MIEPQKVILPPKYYHDNFIYLFDFVQEKYKSILNENEWRFLRKFYCLSEDAQCLFIRFANRKGLFFNVKTLKYEEIENIENCILELAKNEFITFLNDSHLNFSIELLDFLKKDEILATLDIETKKNVQKLKKDDLIIAILNDFKKLSSMDSIVSKDAIIKVNFEIETNFIKFLFFGNRYSDMSEFVMRDMGIMQFEKYDNDKLIAQFSNRKEADEKWYISIQREQFETIKTQFTFEAINEWFYTILDSLKDISEKAKPSLERFKLMIASFFEKNKMLDFALNIYSICTEVPARERKVRILLKNKLTEEAYALLQLMTESSKNADEYFFAIDSLKKLESKSKVSKKSTTSKLSEAKEITISENYRYRVEAGTMDYYFEKGYEAAFTENHLWRALFGLIYWEIIFDSDLVAFHHPLQKRPSDLYLPDFFEKRNAQIQNLFDSFQTSTDLMLHVSRIYNLKNGIANPFVVWLDEIWVIVRKVIERVDLEKIKLVMKEMSKNLVENSRGFPDIMIWNDNDFEFIEVKSPTDSLSNQQLYWLFFFEKIELKSSVLRVYYSKGI